jgi:hypothetical protein
MAQPYFIHAGGIAQPFRIVSFPVARRLHPLYHSWYSRYCFAGIGGSCSQKKPGMAKGPWFQSAGMTMASELTEEVYLIFVISPE